MANDCAATRTRDRILALVVSGNLHTLKLWQVEQTPLLCVVAAQHCHWALLWWMRDHWTDDTVAIAQFNKDGELADFLRRNGTLPPLLEASTPLVPDDVSCNDYLQLRDAIQNGDLPSVKRLYRRRCRPEDADLCRLAVECNQWAVLWWLRCQGSPWTVDTFLAAAYTSNLELMQFLHRNGCPWNADVFAMAARFPRKPILEWLRTHGCPFDTRVADHVAEVGSLDLLRWVLEQGVFPLSATTAHRTLRRSDRTDALSLLCRFDCPLDADLCVQLAMAGGPRRLVLFLLHMGCPYDTRLRQFFPDL